MESTQSSPPLSFFAGVVSQKLIRPLQDPEDKFVTWHNGSRSRLANYEFNTKTRDHMYCPKCGTSMGIDFRDVWREKEGKSYYGINVGLPPPSFSLLRD